MESFNEEMGDDFTVAACNNYLTNPKHPGCERCELNGRDGRWHGQTSAIRTKTDRRHKPLSHKSKHTTLCIPCQNHTFPETFDARAVKYRLNCKISVGWDIATRWWRKATPGLTIFSGGFPTHLAHPFTRRAQQATHDWPSATMTYKTSNNISQPPPMPDKEAIYLHVARLIKSAVHNHLDHISEITGAALQILTRGQINDLLQFAPQVLCSPQIQDHWLTITIIWDDHTGALARTCPRALSVIAATAMYTILGKEMALLVLPTGTALAATEQATVFISAAKGLLLPVQQELAYVRLQMEGEDHKEALLYVPQSKNDDFRALTKHITETSPATLATAALHETEMAWTSMHYQADSYKPFPPDEQFTTENPAPRSMESFSDLGVTVGSPIENWTATTPLDFMALSQAYLFIAHPAHYLTHGADKKVVHFCQGTGNIRTTGIPSRIGNPASTGAGMSTLFGIQDLTEGHASAHTAILHISGLNSGIETMEKKLLCYAGGLAAALPTDGVTSFAVSRFLTAQNLRIKHKFMNPFIAAFTAPYVPTQINLQTNTGRELKPDTAIEYSLTAHTKIKLHTGTSEKTPSHHLLRRNRQPINTTTT